MAKIRPKIFIGFILYNDTAAYLPFFLPSLPAQDAAGVRLIAYDNSGPGHGLAREIVQKDYPAVRVIRSGENIGFARAYNKMISLAAAEGAEYFLAVNPDMILEPQAVEILIAAMDKDQGLGSAAPKVLRWDFSALKKTGLIDTCGIKEKSALRFFDLGQGEPDKGQYDQAEILGPSGAAALYRMAALERVKDRHGYFDSRMFMYFEDCDLAYRLRVAGYRSRLVPEALVYHDRTAQARGQGNWQIARNRRNKSRRVKAWAFCNKHLIFLKYWNKLGIRQKKEVFFYAVKMFFFVILLEQYLLRQYAAVWRLHRSGKLKIDS